MEVFVAVYFQLIGSGVLANSSYLPDHAKSEEREAEEQQRHKFVTVAVGLISGQISDALTGLDPTDQQAADTEVWLAITLPIYYQICCHWCDKLQLRQLLKYM